MKHVSFQNKGLIDIRAVKIFGASSKESKNPIGFFGTGLKYAVAVALRLGCEITLYRGLEKFEFSKAKTRIRVDDFDVVCMNGEELGFTTNLGRTWQAWQAFRELWCNAMDEGGDMTPGALEPTEDTTTVVVSGHPFVEAYHQRDSIILFGSPRWFVEGVEIHEKASKHIYYRNIRVHETQKQMRLTYNIVAHPMELTEDRTLKHQYIGHMHIRDAILSTTDEGLVEAFITAPDGTFEHSLDVSDGDPGVVFMRVVKETPRKLIGNQSVFQVYRRKTRGEKLAPEKLELTNDEKTMIAEALVVCTELGLPAEDYAINVTDDLEDNCMGCVWMGGDIYIARRTFSRGQNQVTGTVFEEMVHAHHRLADESRAMQNYLVDKVVQLVRPGK